MFFVLFLMTSGGGGDDLNPLAGMHVFKKDRRLELCPVAVHVSFDYVHNVSNIVIFCYWIYIIVL
jgi:hypothetical protein